MSRAPQPVPFGEWAPDSATQSGVMQEAKGVISQAGRYAPLHDLTPYKAGVRLGRTCIGARGFFDATGGVHIFAGEERHLFKYVARTPAIVGRPGGYIASEVDGWQFEQFGSFIVAVNSAEKPQVYDLENSQRFADLGGNPPIATTAFRVGNQLCLANGRTLSVSGFNDITDWTYSIATQGVQADVDQRGGKIQTGVGGEVGLIFQERGIIRMSYIGPPTTFQLDTIEWKHGAISREAVSQYGRRTFFVSETGMMLTDSVSEAVSIGENRVDKYFSTRLNYAARNKVCTAVDFARKLWIVAFPSGGSILPNELLIYSMADNRWTHDEIDTSMLFEMPREGISIDDVDAMLAFESTTDADQIETSVDDPKFRETRVQAAAIDHNNELMTFEGPTRPAIITTGEVQPTPLKQTLVDELWPEIDVDTSEVTGFVLTRSKRAQALEWGDNALTWGGSKLIFGAKGANRYEADLNHFGFCPVRLSTRYMQMGIEVAAGVNWSEANGMIWRGSAAGER